MTILSYGTNSSNSEHFDEIEAHRNSYILIYVLLIATVLYLVFQRALALYLFCLKASRRIHEKLLHSVIKAKMDFFHTNPSGRIINRFSKDLYDVDYYLALVLYDLTLVSRCNLKFLRQFQFCFNCFISWFQFCLQAVMSLVLVSLTNYWVMMATVAMSLIFYRLRCIYVSTARCLRRIEALGKLI